MFYNDLIDQAIGLGFLCGQVVIAVSIFLHNLKRLAGILAEHAVHLFLDLHKVVGMDLDVACLAGKATALAAGNQRLMDQDLRIRQGETLTPVPLASKNAPMEAAMPTQMVETSHLIYFMVSWMAIPSVMEPPGLLM